VYPGIDPDLAEKSRKRKRRLRSSLSQLRLSAKTYGHSEASYREIPLKNLFPRRGEKCTQE